MYSSKIKEIWDKIHSTYNITNQPINSRNNKNNIFNIPNLKENKDIFTLEDYHLILDFFVHNFQETSKIFSRFTILDFFSFIYLSNLNIYKEGDLLFNKEDDCNSYIFILKGDINLYTEKDISLKSNELNSTISSGNVYGQLIKDKFKYYLRAKNNISIITILKPNFDELIMSINKKIKTFKSIFIKKFFPVIRIFSDDSINKILSCFERIKYEKYEKLFSKGNYNENIYLIISGEVGYSLKPKSIFDNNNFYYEFDYILLEKLGRGEIIGINSALDGIKNIYNCIVLTDEAEFYRISKGDFLYYFGGKMSESTVNLKYLGDLQDMAVHKKIDYIKNINLEDINLKNTITNNFCIKIPEKNKISFNKGCLIIFEDPIDNVLFEKWKTIKIGLSDFKNKLLGQKKKKLDEDKKNNTEKNSSISNRKDIGIIKKDNTYSLYRVTNGRLNLKLNNNQMKSLNKLNGLCGIKSNNKKEDNNKKNKVKIHNHNKKNDDENKIKSEIKLNEEEEEK